MSSTTRLIITVSIVVGVTGAIAVPQASAGKLSRVRDKTDKTDKQKQEKSERKSAPQPTAKPVPRNSTPQRSKPSKSAARKSSASSSNSSRRGPTLSFSSSSEGSRSRVASVRSKSDARQNATSAPSEGKLAGISSNVRRNQPTVSRPSGPSHNHRPNAHRRNFAHHRHAPRRPGRSPLRMGLHFGSGFGTTYAPTPSSYVVEEYYYGDPIVRAQSTDVPYASGPYVPAEPVSPSNVYPPAPSPEAPYVEPPVVVDEYAAPAETSINTPIATMLKPWNVRLGIEYVGDTDGDVSQFGFDFLANATGGFGIDTDIRTLRENDGEYRDQLWLGDFNIVYELFPSEYIRPRVGVGLNWLADDYGGEAGLNLTVGADMKLMPQLMLTTEADFGTLGDSDFFHANATIGLLQTENVEWYAGYDYVDIGGVTIESVVAGLRFRF